MAAHTLGSNFGMYSRWNKLVTVRASADACYAFSILLGLPFGKSVQPPAVFVLACGFAIHGCDFYMVRALAQNVAAMREAMPLREDAK